MFLTIYMHQSEWLSERGGNFLNLLQKERVPRKGGSLRKGGGFQPWRKLLPHFFSLSAIAFEVDSRKILNYVIIVYQLYFFFQTQSLLIGKVIKNKRSLELVTSFSSSYKTSSKVFVLYSLYII